MPVLNGKGEVDGKTLDTGGRRNPPYFLGHDDDRGLVQKAGQEPQCYHGVSSEAWLTFVVGERRLHHRQSAAQGFLRYELLYLPVEKLGQ